MRVWTLHTAAYPDLSISYSNKVLLMSNLNISPSAFLSQARFFPWKCRPHWTATPINQSVGSGPLAETDTTFIRRLSCIMVGTHRAFRWLAILHTSWGTVHANGKLVTCLWLHVTFLSKDFWKWSQTWWDKINGPWFPIGTPLVSPFSRTHVIWTSQVSGLFELNNNKLWMFDLCRSWTRWVCESLGDLGESVWNSARWNVTGSWSTWHSLPIDLLRVLRERGHHRGAAL